MSDEKSVTLDELVALGRVEVDEGSEEFGSLRTEPLARVCVVNDPFEADLLRGALLAEGIPCLVESYRDAALDGLFQLTRGWGSLIVTIGDVDRASAVVADVRPGLAGGAETAEGEALGEAEASAEAEAPAEADAPAEDEPEV